MKLQRRYSTLKLNTCGKLVLQAQGLDDENLNPYSAIAPIAPHRQDRSAGIGFGSGTGSGTRSKESNWNRTITGSGVSRKYWCRSRYVLPNPHQPPDSLMIRFAVQWS